MTGFRRWLTGTLRFIHQDFQVGENFLDRRTSPLPWLSRSHEGRAGTRISKSFTTVVTEATLDNGGHGFLFVRSRALSSVSSSVSSVVAPLRLSVGTTTSRAF